MARSDPRRAASAVASSRDVGEFSCKACSAALLADCVSLCCCPCALVGLVATAFLKLPWRAGKRCVRSLRRKRTGLRKVQAARKDVGGEEAEEEGVGAAAAGAAAADSGGDGAGGEGRKSMSTARSEAEMMWVELHRQGHLGFGRVSRSTPPRAAGRGTC